MTPADDDVYMTVREFAHLPSADQIAVWQAVEHGRVAWIWATGNPWSGIRRYHRAQVRELLQAHEVAR